MNFITTNLYHISLLILEELKFREDHLFRMILKITSNTWLNPSIPAFLWSLCIWCVLQEVIILHLRSNFVDSSHLDYWFHDRHRWLIISKDANFVWKFYYSYLQPSNDKKKMVYGYENTLTWINLLKKYSGLCLIFFFLKITQYFSKMLRIYIQLKTLSAHKV